MEQVAIQVKDILMLREGATIYASSTILGNIEIGAGSTVAAGSLVLKSVKPGITVAGIPAKELGSSN